MAFDSAAFATWSGGMATEIDDRATAYHSYEIAPEEERSAALVTYENHFKDEIVRAQLFKVAFLIPTSAE